MKSTDIDIDCLEAVLEHLPSEDFINAADCNMQLDLSILESIANGGAFDYFSGKIKAIITSPENIKS